MEYRNELKYIVNEFDLKIIEERLKNIMRYDANMQDNSYNIRSIYFDDYNNTCFYENEAGINKRLKVRIRIYDKSDKLIKLEIKYKNNGMTKKESCNISKNLCEKLTNGEYISIDECGGKKVLYKVFLEQRLHMLKPKIIVEYDRTAFINIVGNVRITFDRNIRASKNIKLFFDDNILANPIQEISTHILEIKYDELLPDYISNVLELNKLRQTSFSKYYFSRIALKEEVK